MVPSLIANCNSTLSNHTLRSLRSALATVDWIFRWNNFTRCAAYELARRKERGPANNSKRGVKPMDHSQQQQQQHSFIVLLSPKLLKFGSPRWSFGQGLRPENAGHSCKPCVRVWSSSSSRPLPKSASAINPESAFAL